MTDITVTTASLDWNAVVLEAWRKRLTMTVARGNGLPWRFREEMQREIARFIRDTRKNKSIQETLDYLVDKSADVPQVGRYQERYENGYLSRRTARLVLKWLLEDSGNAVK